MKTILFHKLLMVSTVLLIVSGAMAKTVQVGGCLPSLQTYPTISQAVIAVTPGSTILVCPGSYPEQVTITQPLTLRGVQSGNAANPTITVPAGGLTQSVIAPSNGAKMFFQVLVQGTGAGLVNISNIAVDGSNNGNPNGWLEGIYYQNSSGTLFNVASFWQVGNGLGFGIFLESTTSAIKTITVSRSSVHDFDGGGMRCNCSNTNMTVDIHSNSVVGSNSPSSDPPGEGIDMDATGKISNNSVFSNPAAPATSAGVGIAFVSNMLVSGNTVVGWGAGIWPVGNSNIIKSNRVSKAGGGITLSGTNNDVEHNFLANFPGGAGISFNCTGSGNTVIHNQVNDATWGIIDPHGTNTIAPNTFTNVQKLVSPPC
jgi:hypothetical protein